MSNYKTAQKKIIVLLALITIIFSSCQLGRFIIYNFADIHDHKKFQSRPLHNDSVQYHFAKSETGLFPKNIEDANKNKILFDDFLEKNGTVAFLIIKNDTIQYEKYFHGYDKGYIVPSFSMAKSITSILIGCAIDDGLIQSVEDPIIQYIPELKDNGFSKVTIKHLLQMTSGIKYNESYVNPFGNAASYYYGRNLRKLIGKMKMEQAPGVGFKYVSGSTQLLGLVLERSLKGKTITGYLQEKIWTPLGMEFDASWSIDKKKNGLEKTFCCINARAIDYAKIGQLYLNKGSWNGKQIVSKKWVEESTKIDETNGSVAMYQYQWWIPSAHGDFMAIGILGQYIYVNPEKNLVIVRLGKKQGKVNWWHLFPKLSEIY